MALNQAVVNAFFLFALKMAFFKTNWAHLINMEKNTPSVLKLLMKLKMLRRGKVCNALQRNKRAEQPKTNSTHPPPSSSFCSSLFQMCLITPFNLIKTTVGSLPNDGGNSLCTIVGKDVLSTNGGK